MQLFIPKNSEKCSFYELVIREFGEGINIGGTGCLTA